MKKTTAEKLKRMGVDETYLSECLKIGCKYKGRYNFTIFYPKDFKLLRSENILVLFRKEPNKYGEYMDATRFNFWTEIEKMVEVYSGMLFILNDTNTGKMIPGIIDEESVWRAYGNTLVGEKFLSKIRSGSVPKNVTVTVTEFFLSNDRKKGYVGIDIGGYALDRNDFTKLLIPHSFFEQLYAIDDKSYLYLKKYIPYTEELDAYITNHTKNKEIKNPEICAYYKDMDDFYGEWCDMLLYTKAQADNLFKLKSGEFLILPNEQGIIRFVM